MGEWSDFEKYIINRLDSLDKKVEDKIDHLGEQVACIDRKVTGIRSKVALISTVIAATFTGIVQYFTKKIDL